jgi:hypothetical protein
MRKVKLVGEADEYAWFDEAVVDEARFEQRRLALLRSFDKPPLIHPDVPSYAQGGTCPWYYSDPAPEPSPERSVVPWIIGLLLSLIVLCFGLGILFYYLNGTGI